MNRFIIFNVEVQIINKQSVDNKKQIEENHLESTELACLNIDQKISIIFYDNNQNVNHTSKNHKK